MYIYNKTETAHLKDGLKINPEILFRLNFSRNCVKLLLFNKIERIT